MDNLPYLLALHSIDGLGPIRLKKVICQTQIFYKQEIEAIKQVLTASKAESQETCPIRPYLLWLLYDNNKSLD